MSTWLRTRRAWSPLAAVALSAVLLAALGDSVVPVPVAVGADGMALWSTFLPLLLAVAVCDSLASKSQGVETRPARRLLLLDAGLFVVACALGAVVFAWFAGSFQPPLGAAGHVLVLTGVATWTTLRRGPGAGSLAASALLVLTTLYGVRAPLGPYVRVLQPDGDVGWTLLVGSVLCLGVLLTILLDRGRVHLSAGARAAE